MSFRKISLFGFAVLMLALASCGTARRTGKDAFVVVASPVLIPYGAATDGYTSAKEVRDGLDGGPSAEVLAFLPAFVFHTVKHTFYVLLHAVDLPLNLFYGLAELHPYGPEITPLDYYTNTWFDRPEDRKSAIEAESGELVEPIGAAARR